MDMYVSLLNAADEVVDRVDLLWREDPDLSSRCDPPVNLAIERRYFLRFIIILWCIYFHCLQLSV